ncbi:hypothetical protein [Streptomyces sp. NPDC007904]|uniref:hypothetical protein n=1 Tax=Streptomyces sp. NPDC007904 TaxID=3364787 RepID=UPI0036EA1AA3
MSAQIPYITFPALMLTLITVVFIGRRRFSPNVWLLSASAALACTALLTALGRSPHFSSTWMTLSAAYFVLALTVKRPPAAKDTQANEKTRVSLTKDEAQP